MSESKNQSRVVAYKRAVPFGPNVRPEAVAMAGEATPWGLVIRGFWKKKLVAIYGGGIQTRLLIWGLSLFGIALLFVVGAGYFYMVRQIRHDAVALQSELASVTGEQIRTFVRRKIDRFSDNAAALTLYPLGSKEQQLL